MSSLSEEGHQWSFLPKAECLLLVPLVGLPAKGQVEIPQHSGKDNPHLIVRQIFPYAITGSNRKCLHGIAVVIVEWRPMLPYRLWKPTFGTKVFRSMKVVLGPVGGRLVDGHKTLNQCLAN